MLRERRRDDNLQAGDGALRAHAQIVFAEAIVSAKSFKKRLSYDSILSICCGALDLSQAAS